MTGVVNLNKVRKARAKAEARQQAEANSVKFGRPKARRFQEEAEAELARQRLEAHRRDTPPVVSSETADQPPEP